MKIEVQHLADGRFALQLGERRIILSEADARVLQTRLDAVLRPEGSEERDQRYRTFLANLRGANDSGIQALLRRAAHDDILVLLHTSEHDEALKRKLYGNMSDNSVKMYVEDLLFEFREGVPDYRFDGAMIRLIDTVENLVQSGTLTLDGPPQG